MRFLGVPLTHSCSTSLTSNIVTSRYIHGLLLRPLRGPKQEACTRGQAGGKGFEKLSRKGSLGFENRHDARADTASAFVSGEAPTISSRSRSARRSVVRASSRKRCRVA